MTDIGIKIVSFLHIFHKIISFTSTYCGGNNKNDEQFRVFVSKSIGTVLSYFISLLLQLTEEPDMKIVTKLMESDEIYLIFSNLSEIKLIR